MPGHESSDINGKIPPAATSVDILTRFLKGEVGTTGVYTGVGGCNVSRVSR